MFCLTNWIRLHCFITIHIWKNIIFIKDYIQNSLLVYIIPTIVSSLLFSFIHIRQLQPGLVEVWSWTIYEVLKLTFWSETLDEPFGSHRYNLRQKKNRKIEEKAIHFFKTVQIISSSAEYVKAAIHIDEKAGIHGIGVP